MRPVSASFVLTLALAACGGGGGSPSSPSSTPSEATSLAIAQQVVETALGGVITGSGLRKSENVPFWNMSCNQVCTGSGCEVTCPIDESFDCRFGGSAHDEGQVAGTLDGEMSGEAALAGVQTYNACRPTETLTIEGAPSTTVTGKIRFVQGELAYEQTVRIVGAVSFVEGPDWSGQCDVDVSVNFGRMLDGTATGTACGYPVCVSL